LAALVLADPTGQRSLGDLAGEAGTSARTATRLFPTETGFTFKEWRQRARIMSGVELLSDGVTIKQVAGRLGFSSVAAFSHAFRQVLGIQPKALLRVRQR
jgi:transcriptional regulator GlxA family with amidase domain